MSDPLVQWYELPYESTPFPMNEKSDSSPTRFAAGIRKDISTLCFEKFLFGFTPGLAQDNDVPAL